MCIFLLRSRLVTPQVPENLFSMSLVALKVPMWVPCCGVSVNSPQFAKDSGTGKRRGDSQAFRQFQGIQGNRQFRQFHLWKSPIPREPWLTVHRGPEVRIARDPMCEFLMLGACFVYLFIAEPPSNATGPRKCVFNEFRWDQGPHVDTMLRSVDE